MFRGLILVTRGILRSTEVRRWIMFGVVLAALAMVFLGSTFLEEVLRQRPLLFVSYWLVCGWLTLLTILLALYDLLIMRAAGKATRAKLRRDMLGDDERPEC